MFAYIQEAQYCVIKILNGYSVLVLRQYKWSHLGLECFKTRLAVK